MCSFCLKPRQHATLLCDRFEKLRLTHFIVWPWSSGNFLYYKFVRYYQKYRSLTKNSSMISSHSAVAILIIAHRSPLLCWTVMGRGDFKSIKAQFRQISKIFVKNCADWHFFCAVALNLKICAKIALRKIANFWGPYIKEILNARRNIYVKLPNY